MSVLAKGPGGRDVIFVKGAPEAVLANCSHVSHHLGGGWCISECMQDDERCGQGPR